MTETPTRRKILKALGVGGAASGLSAASTATSGDEGTTTGGDTNDSGFCALKNTVYIRTEAGASEPVQYRIAVTEQIELKNGQRTSEVRGTVKNSPGGFHEVEFPYSGEMKCLNVKGPGHAQIHQERPCLDKNH